MRHRVEKKRARVVPLPLPRDCWQNSTFVEATGRELEVVWDGHRDAPLLCGEIEQTRVRDQPNTLHLKPGR